MVDPQDLDIGAPDVDFMQLYNRLRAVANICLHLFLYNYAMLGLATSLPPFMMPQFLDFSVHAPHILSLIFPVTAALIAYLSASHIFTHVNLYAGKHLIPVPHVSKYTEDVYPLLAAVIVFVVSKEVIDTLGGRHAWIWTLRLGACCIVETAFLFLLVMFCSLMVPSFSAGMGTISTEVYDQADNAV